MPLRVYYTDHHEIPLPPAHKFPIAKYRLLREELARTGLFLFTPAPLAAPEIIALVHDTSYVEAFLAGTLAADVMRRIGFPWSPGLVARTLASVGGTLNAAEDALTNGVGGTLAGGTHHAFRNTGAGFCVFNDIAVAIEYLRSRGSVRRAAVVDLDVHQGDGTAKIFEDDSEVLTLSIHGRNNFPFRKQSSSIDCELPDGVADSGYLDTLRAVLPQLWSFRPEILFYQSGVDALATDTLGRLKLSPEGLAARDSFVISGAHSRNIPLAITLGGGYSRPIEETVNAHAATFRTAASIYSASRNELKNSLSV